MFVDIFLHLDLIPSLVTTIFATRVLVIIGYQPAREGMETFTFTLVSRRMSFISILH